MVSCVGPKSKKELENDFCRLEEKIDLCFSLGNKLSFPEHFVALLGFYASFDSFVLD